MQDDTKTQIGQLLADVAEHFGITDGEITSMHIEEFEAMQIERMEQMLQATLSEAPVGKLETIEFNETTGRKKMTLDDVEKAVSKIEE